MFICSDIEAVREYVRFQNGEGWIYGYDYTIEEYDDNHPPVWAEGQTVTEWTPEETREVIRQLSEANP